jgi:DNA-binding beta-propeller fold protein YncE
VWVANSGDKTIQAVDPESGQVHPPIPVGSSAESALIFLQTSPVALAFDGARLWVANMDDDTVQSLFLHLPVDR